MPVPEDPAAGASASQDTVTEEAIGSPLAMWELEIQNIELEKGEGGLGFSILDYQVRGRLSPRRSRSRQRHTEADPLFPRDLRRTPWTPQRR